MCDLAWIDAAITAARPQSLAALLRYFRNLDIAEEAFQEVCLRALQKWPLQGPPRDPAAWLIMVGRNFAVDQLRHSRRNQRLPDDQLMSDLDDAENALAERLDSSQYRDDILRLLFNEGYSSSGGEGETQVRAALCDEAIRLTRLLLRLFSSEPEVMGLLALMLLQHARTPARLDAEGSIVLLEQQDRGAWNAEMIAEGLAMVDKALWHRRAGPYQVQAAIAALHDRARTAAETDWQEIEQLYGVLEQMQPSPVITLNRAVAVSKAKGEGLGAAQALAMIEPLAARLSGYFHYFGVKGALHQQLGDVAAARAAFDRAIALAHTPAEAAHIRQHLDALSK